MDVGQIIEATSSPARRGPETRDEAYDDFSNYLEDQSPAKDVPMKATSVPETDPREPVANPVTENDPVTDVAADTTKAERPSGNLETPVERLVSDVPTVQSTTVPQTVSTQVKLNNVSTPKTNEPLLVTTMGNNGQLSSGSPDTDFAMTTQALEKTPAQKPVSGNPAQNNILAQQNNIVGNQVIAPVVAQVTTPVTASTKKPDAKVEGKRDIVPPLPTAEGVTKQVPTDSLEKIRMDAAGRLSEKDILTNKIAELLQDSKGKISLVSTTPAKTFQATLASSTNLVTAASGDGSPGPFGMTVQAAAQNTDVPFGQIVSTLAQGITQTPANPGEATQSLAPPPAAAAVQGVDATAINSASQANNAARIAGQTPVAEQVSMQLSNAAKEGADRIKISLHPSELGRVDVKLEIGQDGRVIAAIAVDKQETLDLLQRDARSLEKALQDAGFDTGSGSLNFSLNQNGQDEAADFAGRETGVPQLIEDADMSPIAPSQIATEGIGNGNLDIQV
jgi:flagellar hook-length control protein FliK